MSGTEARKVALKGKESLADYIPRLGGVPLDFQPGTRWAYSAQAGFDVLARIVEVTSGMPFDQFTKTRIFDPLGMKDTFFYPAEGNPRLVTRYARGQSGQLEKQGLANFMNGAYFSGGGGLMSTAEDYLQFAQMLLNGGRGNGKVLLSPRTVEMMGSVHAPDTLPGRPRGEGYGLSMRVVNDPVGAQHIPVAGQLRLERRLRHALLGRSEGEDRRGADDADAQPGDSRRFRERGHVRAGRRDRRRHRHELTRGDGLRRPLRTGSAGGPGNAVKRRKVLSRIPVVRQAM